MLCRRLRRYGHWHGVRTTRKRVHDQMRTCQSAIYKNIPLDEVMRIREDQVKKLEQDVKKRRGGA